MSVFLATKVREGEIWLPRFISQVEQLEGISEIAVMYGESLDKSYSYLKHWRETSKHVIKLYKDPYIPPEDRHGAKLAIVKKDIQKLLKQSGCDYYLNLDCDLIHLPKNLVPKLMEWDKDIIGAMNWIEGRNPPVFFDSYEFRTRGCRFHPLNPPGVGLTEPFEVDSVSTVYLAKAEVELAGEYKNPYPHLPFCQDLRKQGYAVWVDPTTHVEHIDLEELGYSRQPLPVASSMSPYVNNQNAQFRPDQVGAQMFHLKVMTYRMNQIRLRPELVGSSESWLRSRPLITASYKVHVDDLDWLPYSLASIYDYVDQIDLVTGPIKLRKHEYSKKSARKLDKVLKEDYDNKIKVYDGVWRDKQEIQRKLLEVCTSKWMLFIDSDEVIEGMEHLRAFCVEHPDGTKIYARPKRFLNFWHDMKHIAYSLNPISPWAQWGLPHPFLIHRDIPGLNFGAFHTMPTDGFGQLIHGEDNQDRKHVLDMVEVFHFGSVKPEKAMRAKLLFEKSRGIQFQHEVGDDPWLSGVMPADMVLEEYTGGYPAALRGHRDLNLKRVEITQRKPHYEYKVVNK